MWWVVHKSFGTWKHGIRPTLIEWKGIENGCKNNNGMYTTPVVN